MTPRPKTADLRQRILAAAARNGTGPRDLRNLVITHRVAQHRDAKVNELRRASPFVAPVTNLAISLWSFWAVGEIDRQIRLADLAEGGAR